jgi:hypothetical protein
MMFGVERRTTGGVAYSPRELIGGLAFAVPVAVLRKQKRNR